MAEVGQPILLRQPSMIQSVQKRYLTPSQKALEDAEGSVCCDRMIYMCCSTLCCLLSPVTFCSTMCLTPILCYLSFDGMSRDSRKGCVCLGCCCNIFSAIPATLAVAAFYLVLASEHPSVCFHAERTACADCVPNIQQVEGQASTLFPTVVEPVEEMEAHWNRKNRIVSALHTRGSWYASHPTSQFPAALVSDLQACPKETCMVYEGSARDDGKLMYWPIESREACLAGDGPITIDQLEDYSVGPANSVNSAMTSANYNNAANGGFQSASAIQNLVSNMNDKQKALAMMKLSSGLGQFSSLTYSNLAEWQSAVGTSMMAPDDKNTVDGNLARDDWADRRPSLARTTSGNEVYLSPWYAYCFFTGIAPRRDDCDEVRDLDPYYRRQYVASDLFPSSYSELVSLYKAYRGPYTTAMGSNVIDATQEMESASDTWDRDYMEGRPRSEFLFGKGTYKIKQFEYACSGQADYNYDPFNQTYQQCAQVCTDCMMGSYFPADKVFGILALAALGITVGLILLCCQLGYSHELAARVERAGANVNLEASMQRQQRKQQQAPVVVMAAPPPPQQQPNIVINNNIQAPGQANMAEELSSTSSKSSSNSSASSKK